MSPLNAPWISSLYHHPPHNPTLQPLHSLWSPHSVPNSLDVKPPLKASFPPPPSSTSPSLETASHFSTTPFSPPFPTSSIPTSHLNSSSSGPSLPVCGPNRCRWGALLGEDARPTQPPSVHQPRDSEWSSVCPRSVGRMSMASVSVGEKKPTDSWEAALKISPGVNPTQPVGQERVAVKSEL